MIDVDVAQRVARHLGIIGVVGILHHGDAAAALDRVQPGGAVVEHAGQHDADDLRRVVAGRGAEHHVDRRAEAVLARAAAQPRAAVTQHQVLVGRRDVDPPGRERCAVLGELGRQRGGARQHGRQQAIAGARMADHEHRGGERGVERAEQRLQRADAAGRGADDDDVVVLHGREAPGPSCKYNGRSPGRVRDPGPRRAGELPQSRTHVAHTQLLE
jgi:hypothetical protein